MRSPPSSATFLRHLSNPELFLFPVLLLLTGFVTLIYHPIYQTIRPFFPSDASLWYVHRKDTFPTYLLFILHYFILFPILLHLNPSPSPRLPLNIFPATAFAIFFIEVLKGYVGRLRPSFASYCLSNPLPSASDLLLLPAITSNSECTMKDAHELFDARRSFPSGHAALAVCGAAYFQFCIIKFTSSWGDLKRTVAYACSWLVMMLAGWVAASRITDNAHHVSDVAFGSLLGFITASVHFAYVVWSENEYTDEKRD